jgi:hypothetical protein
MYIITVKLPRNPSHPAASKCNHVKRPDGHCSEMYCTNYISSCPKHSIYGPDGRCSRGKVTGQCPVGIGQCTDVTGEHHSYIDPDARTIEEAEANAIALGAQHITRIEELHTIR